ncbi:MAG: MBL fold metallo-hydrolase, partial [Clostridia bacterium]|nr:MBL fold metallo-hydrolase [Clostridia bacterium]
MKKIYGQRNDLPIEVIKKGVFRLNEFDGTNCYLVLGEEKAMLIDCGTGFCDMRGAVRKITDLPIILVATHGHGDHMGGRGQFEEIYIHENDCTKINMLQGSRIFRKFFTACNAPVKANGFKMKDAKRLEFKTKVIPFADGHEFDLGGKIIKAKLTPGHTKGSVALIDEADGIVFSGDNVCDALWMQLPGCTSIEEWIPSAEWLYEISKKYDVYWGHRVAHLESEYIKTVLDWGKELVNNT